MALFSLRLGMVEVGKRAWPIIWSALTETNGILATSEDAARVKALGKALDAAEEGKGQQ